MIAAIDHIVHTAIAQRIFPGAVVLVAQANRVLHASGYGTTMYDDPGAQPVTLATTYDIASLTKMFTATAALHLYDHGAIDLDTPAARYLPELRARAVTVRHLLTHTAGLHIRMSTLRHLSPADMRAACYALEPQTPPGTRTMYVNINTLLLGDLVARVAGQPLDAVIRDTILAPLELLATGYGYCPPEPAHASIAPTEWDHDWRGRLVQGTVHDESTHALGGVAGHAGMFSIAADLWAFAHMWLSGGMGQHGRVLREETVALATGYQAPWLRLADPPAAIRCGLGWMLDRPDVMGRVPAGTYGHTGFTGPLIAVVPAHALIVVILTNRTYPQRPAARNHFPPLAAIMEAAVGKVES